MKINKARTQLYTHATVYYVRSESNPKVKYIVLQVGKNYFCQCADFIARHLPLFGTPGFTHCKHIKAVKDNPFARNEPKPPVTVPKQKFGVFYVATLGSPFRSMDVSGTFLSKAAALRAINTNKKLDPKNYEVYPV